MEPQPVTCEIIVDAPAAKVWDALTKKEQLQQWYFNIPDFELREGATFNFYESEAKQYHHQCTITAIEPLKKLQHTWMHPTHSKGSTLLTWELLPEGDKTRIRLTHSGIETLADGGPAFAKENYEQGWRQIVGESLRNFLEQ